MTKTGMLCPFSHELCRECPVYRGRHHFLCIQSTYRADLEGKGRQNKSHLWQTEPQPEFEVPPSLPPNPRWLAFNEYIERKRK